MRRSLPVLLFAAVVALTLALAAWSMRQNAAERQALFERRTETLRLSLLSTVRAYLDILPSLRIVAGAPITDAQFKRYTESVLSDERFPGLTLTFVAERFDDAGRDAYVARAREDRSVLAEGHPQFEVQPPGRRPDYMVLRHQFPPDVPREGYDLFDPSQNYRAGVEQALAESGLVATGPLQLARDRDRPASPELTSIVVRAATFHDTSPPTGRQARVALASGVVGIGFRTAAMVRAVLPAELRGATRVRVTDPLAGSAAPALFDSDAAADTRPGRIRFDLPVANRRWQVEVTPPLHAWWDDADGGTGAILAAGLVAALSLALLTGGLNRAGLNAEARVRDGLAQLEQDKIQLERSEARLRLLFENSFDAVLNTRPGAGVISANPAACALFRQTELQLRAADRTEIADFTDPRLKPLFDQREATGRMHGQMRMRRGDGQLFEAEVSSMTYRDLDGTLLASLIVRDLSTRIEAAAERQRLETQLRNAQKMEAVGTLAGGIAHDFNNVLAVVLGGASLLSAELGQGNPAMPHIERMRQAGLRARTLVQQLLTFSRPPTDGYRAQPLGPLVQEALGLLRVTLPATVRLEAQVAAEPLYVVTDATQVQQILFNLCTNAWQAMPGHRGRIDVTLAAADGPDPLRQQWARLSVRDDGAGMPASVRDRIFEPFFTTKANSQGTGLGLAMVHGIVTGHSGRVEVRSAPGEGTVFDVWLPLVAAPEQPPAPLRADSPAAAFVAPVGQGERILCVDDDEVLRLTIEALLAHQGYVVESHADPAAALAVLASAPQDFALVVTDFNMPLMSGLEVAQAVQKLRANLPVLIVSGHVTGELRAVVARLPLTRVMRKEFVAEQLVPRVSQLLELASHRVTDA